MRDTWLDMTDEQFDMMDAGIYVRRIVRYGRCMIGYIGCMVRYWFNDLDAYKIRYMMDEALTYLRSASSSLLFMLVICRHHISNELLFYGGAWSWTLPGGFVLARRRLHNPAVPH